MNIGIDLGLKTTAVVLSCDGKVIKEHQFGSDVSKEGKKLVKFHPAARYRYYYNELQEFVSSCPCTIIMEEPMGSFGGNSIKLAELKGIYLIAVGEYVLCSKIFLPKATEIKKFFTGRGDATKEDMVNECIKRGYIPKSHHLADAYAMSLMFEH